MTKMKFGTVISSLAVEAFIAKGDVASARELLGDVQRRASASGDVAKLAAAIIALTGKGATGN